MRLAPLTLCLFLSAYATAEQTAQPPIYSLQSVSGTVVAEEDEQWYDATQPIILRLMPDTVSADVPVGFELAPQFQIQLGDTDVSELFNFVEHSLISSTTIALPYGEHEVVISQYVAEGWQEIGRQTVRIISPSGIKHTQHSVQLDLTVNSQLDERVSGDAYASERKHYVDADARLAYQGEIAHQSMTVTSAATVLGVSNRQQALQFGTRFNDASKWDLADYLVTVQTNRHQLQLGHTAYGNHPLLIDQLSRRGITWQYQPSAQLSMGAALLSGVDIVGAQNLTGLSSINQSYVHSAGLQSTLLQGDRFGLDINATYVNAQRQADNDFASAGVNSAEKSRGSGVVLGLTDAEARWQATFAWSASKYDNPVSDYEAEILGIQSASPDTKHAYTIDLGFVAFEQQELPWGQPLSLSLFARHRNIAPLYQSLGAYVAANIRRTELGGQFQLGNINGNVALSEARDNLDNIPTLLTTETTQQSVSLNWPLALDWPEQNWLPTVSYQYLNVHQLAVNAPLEEESGFNTSSHLPDQVSRNHDVSLQWQAERMGLGWQTQYAQQDNRQVGRELADFISLRHSANIDYQLSDALSLSLAANQQRQHDVESALTQYSRGLSLGMQWSSASNWQVAVNFGVSRDSADGDDSRSTATNADVVLSKGFSDPWPWLPGNGQFSLRLQHNEARLQNPLFELFSSSKTTAALCSVSFSY